MMHTCTQARDSSRIHLNRKCPCLRVIYCPASVKKYRWNGRPWNWIVQREHRPYMTEFLKGILRSTCHYLVVFELQKPVRDSWGTGLEAMQSALEMEKSVNQALLDLHRACSKHDDMQVSKASVYKLIVYIFQLTNVLFDSFAFLAYFCLLR